MEYNIHISNPNKVKLKGFASHVWDRYGDRVHKKELTSLPERIKLIFDDSVFEAKLFKSSESINHYMVIDGAH